MFADMEVLYEDHMGSDLKVVNAARVSFGKRSDWVDKLDDLLIETWKGLKLEDENLIAFLARGCRSGEWKELIDDTVLWADRDEVERVLNHVKRMPTHWTPFAHCAVTLIFKVPLFVARQLGKHQTGFVWSEESRRYIDTDPEFYLPDSFRMKAADVKQGSGDVSPYSDFYLKELEKHSQMAAEWYIEAIDDGVCPEQARMILPQNTMVNFWMTGSLYGWANLFNQRSDPHAQKETQLVAEKIGEIVEPLFPVSWRELTK